MKKILTIIIVIVSSISTTMSQCTTSYSFTASSDTVSFTNLSSVSNAHYFWNFGDGTGSNEVNPVHVFPGTGDYMVTLFAKDTVSNCSSYYEQWVSVIKPSVGICHPGISDSIYTSGGRDWLMVYDTGVHCDSNLVYFTTPLDCPERLPISLPTTASRMVCSAVYYDTYDTPEHVYAKAFKTVYHNYSSSHNYGDSSANFEFIVTAKNAVSSYETVLFTAMNKRAMSYQWFYGNTLVSNSDTVSLDLNFNYLLCMAMVELVIQTPTGYRDTIEQNIMTGDSISAVLGVNNLKNAGAQVRVYPNPNNGMFNLEISPAELVSASQPIIEVYNVLGEKVYSQSIVPGSSFIVNLSGQPNGIYLYRVITTNGDLVGEGKVVVQR